MNTLAAVRHRGGQKNIVRVPQCDGMSIKEIALDITKQMPSAHAVLVLVPAKPIEESLDAQTFIRFFA